MVPIRGDSAATRMERILPLPWSKKGTVLVQGICPSRMGSWPALEKKRELGGLSCNVWVGCFGMSLSKPYVGAYRRANVEEWDRNGFKTVHVSGELFMTAFLIKSTS